MKNYSVHPENLVRESRELNKDRVDCVKSIIVRLMEGKPIATQEALEFGQEIKIVLRAIEDDVSGAQCVFFGASSPDAFVKTLSEFAPLEHE